MVEKEDYDDVLDEHRRRMKKIKAGEYVEAESLDESLKRSEELSLLNKFKEDSTMTEEEAAKLSKKLNRDLAEKYLD